MSSIRILQNLAKRIEKARVRVIQKDGKYHVYVNDFHMLAVESWSECYYYLVGLGFGANLEENLILWEALKDEVPEAV